MNMPTVDTLSPGPNDWPDASPVARLHRREAQHAAQLKLSRVALEGEASLDALLDTAVRLVADTLHVEFCKVLELLPGSESLRLRAGVGWKPGLVGNICVSTGPDSQAGVTIDRDAPIVVDDLTSDDRLNGPSLLLEHGVRSGLSCVIRGRDGLAWGVIGAHTSRRRHFSSDEVDFLQSVADTLAALFQREQAEARARWQERQFRLVVNSLPMLISYVTPDLVYRYANATYETWLGVSPNCIIGRTLPEVLDSKTWARSQPHVLAVLQGESRCYDNTVSAPGKPDRAVQVTLIPDTAEDGHLHGFFAMAFDITERSQREEQIRLIAGELDHRVKNILARVQSMTRQTARRCTSMDAFLRGYLPRLRALGTANELLTRTEWRGAAIGDVVATAAESAGAELRNVHLSGPHAMLNARMVLALHLICHEMFTNAIKYGGLSNVDGSVRVAWEVEEVEEACGAQAQRCMVVHWQEDGGPPPQAPVDSGFGSHVISRSMDYDLKGHCELNFQRPEGLVARFSFPLPEASDPCGVAANPTLVG